MQEPTTTTAATSSCHCLPGSPDAAIAQRRCSAIWKLPFALCPLPDPVTTDAALHSLTTRAFPEPRRVAHLNARNNPAHQLPPVLPGIVSPHRLPYKALQLVPDSALRAALEESAADGTFRHRGDASPGTGLLAAGRAHAARLGRNGGGAGRTSGCAHASARGARAGRCVGRGRARVTCTPRSRRLPNGLSSRYLGWGWCGAVGSRVAQVVPRTVV